MNRDQPPCNSCSKHECRACAWTSPLDASYRTLLRSQSLMSIIAVSVRDQEQMPAEPSWFSLAGKRVAKLLTGWSSPRAH